MTAPQPLGAAIGQQVRLRREQRGISAAELARRAGLSKATMSALEAGRGNPTVDTLDAIAQALAVPLADVLTVPERQGTVLHRAEPVTRPVQQHLLQRVPVGHQTETWTLHLDPGTTLEGVPHAAGTLELLVLVRGALVAGHRDDRRGLTPGDALSFDGSAPHSYTAGEQGADVVVVLTSPATT